MKDTVFQNAPTLSRFLRMAVVAGVESAVQIHIDRGDDLNARDVQGQTPLMLSAARNKAAICKLLLAAGADANLLDPLGRNALGIALAASASEAAHAIKNDRQPSAAPSPTLSLSSESVRDLLDEIPTRTSNDYLVSDLAQTATALSIEPIAAAMPPSITAWTSELDVCEGDIFDVSGWEAEEDQLPPEGDSTLLAVAFATQSAITEHQPIDISADWDDFDAFLPDRATPLLQADDAEARNGLRLVLLRAIREGSVPQAAVDDVALGDNGEPDPEACALLGMVINDLGAETDERFEYSAPHESFEVFVAEEEKLDEEDVVAEALAFVDDWASRRNDPLRIYQREYQRQSLLTADEEVALSQAMEQGIEKALDALAYWPSGIGVILDAAKRAAAGTKPLRWLSSGAQAELQDGEGVLAAESYLEAESSSETEPLDEANLAEDRGDFQEKIQDELTAFCRNAEFLAGLSIGGTPDAPEWSSCRSAIASLRLTRSFLMTLVDSVQFQKSGPALVFNQAIGDYQSARDKMVSANLKLVVSIAKKYLFSGQPLDDLLQEGNLGLLKAVDRYDWRRGFKFSTYATWWIRQKISRSIADKSKMIRLPVHVYEKTQRIANVSYAFDLKHGRSPSIEEISALIDLPIDKVAALVLVSLEPLPIDGLHDFDNLVAADSKEKFTARDPMEIVADLQLTGLVDRFLGELKRKEQHVVRMRFGIGIQDSMTLEEIGTRFDVTRERVRQIEAKALRKLKHPSRLENLRLYFNGPSSKSRNESSEAPDVSSDEADGDELTLKGGT